MGETIDLFERDPRQQLYGRADEFFTVVSQIYRQSSADVVHPTTVGQHDAWQQLLHAIISDELSKDVFLHNNEDGAYSISHDIYLNISGREVYIAGVDKLPEYEAYRLPIDFEDTDIDDVAMLYVANNDMPFVVEFAAGEMFDPFQNQEHRRQYLSADDCRSLAGGLDAIAAGLLSGESNDS